MIPLKRDALVGDKKLKDYRDILEQYKDKEVINILVLSGGGLRGMVPLHVLAYLEEITGKKVGDLFDFLAGTSTGAVSVSTFAVGDNAGGYKYSARNILDNYYDNSFRMFNSPWYHQYLTMFGLFAPRFLPDNKIAVLETYFRDMTIGELKGNILIPVYNIDQNNLQIVKNWNQPRGDSNDNYLARDLINGASNPPMLFPPVAFSINNRSHLFIDPAVLMNNPVLYVLLYVRTLFPHKPINIVAVGNGGSTEANYNYRHMFSFGLYGLYQYLFSAPSLSSKLAIEFVEDLLFEAEKVDKNMAFFRVNSIPIERLSSTHVTVNNLDKISRFGQQMVEENRALIHGIAVAIKSGIE